MEAQLEHPAEETKRLRRRTDEPVSVVALPAFGVGASPAPALTVAERAGGDS